MTANWSGAIRPGEPVISADGCQIAAVRWDGMSSPLILAVHATGFCKEMWGPVVDPYLSGTEVVAFDQRGHGDSEASPPPFDWWDLGRDALAVASRLGGGTLLGVGHSSGATALIMAELMRPGTFPALVLIEPVVFPGPFAYVPENPMTSQALRRRSRFPSAEAAAASFRGRGPFARWTEQALTAYVRYGFRADDDAWVLKCRPEVEGEFYRGATAHGVWDRLGEVACPVVLLAGADSESHPRAFIERQGQQFRSATVVVVPGATHFVPMERPEEVANEVSRVLGALRTAETAR
jgi:pimeloyl-ACP methyl ester carboxylesterase